MADDPDDYARGRRDGLRLAIETLAAEEQKWAALIGESRAARTNEARRIRHKAFAVAGARLRTVLNRMKPRRDEADIAEIAAALDRVGL
jgi:hypothetical protein